MPAGIVRSLTMLGFFAAVLLSGGIASFAKADDVTIDVIDGVAIKGADPVSYFSGQAPVAGKSEISVDWQGVTWRFSTVANRDAFVADPAKFAPQFGGYCATGLSFGKKVPIDPAYFRILGGKLYLNASADAQAYFDIAREGTIRKAKMHWSKAETVPADKL